MRQRPSRPRPAARRARRRLLPAALLGSDDGAGPRSYLTARGLSDVLDQRSRWRVGYAPPGWTNLTEHLRGRGYSDHELEAAGLAMRTRRDTLVDRFRDRVMLPVRDHDSRQVIAFIGRARPDAGLDVPKYLNSPDTPLYRKGEQLYGLAEHRNALAARAPAHPGRRPARRPRRRRLPQLHPDAAARGRAQRHSPDPPPGHRPGPARCCRGRDHRREDNDAGGRAAAARAHTLLSVAYTDTTRAAVPAGADPADVLRHHGPDALRDALTRATTPLADLAVDHRLDQLEPRTTLEGRVGALRAIAPQLAALPAGDVARQVARVAARLNLDPSTVTREITEAVTHAAGAPIRLADRDHRLDLDPAAKPTAASVAAAGFAGPPRAPAASSHRVDPPAQVARSATRSR